jgi:hypothetical protein
MARQNSFDSLESTRLAFLKLEHCCLDCDAAAVVHLRHRFLTRLADLEAELAIIQNQALLEAAGTARDPSFGELETLEEDSANVPPHKLD